MKPFKRGTGMSLDGSLGFRFGEMLTWYRRYWGSYYMFQYELDAFSIRVFKSVYNPDVWEDEWVEIHHFDTYTVHQWSKRADKDD